VAEAEGEGGGGEAGTGGAEEGGDGTGRVTALGGGKGLRRAGDVVSGGRENGCSADGGEGRKRGERERGSGRSVRRGEAKKSFTMGSEQPSRDEGRSGPSDERATGACTGAAAGVHGASGDRGDGELAIDQQRKARSQGFAGTRSRRVWHTKLPGARRRD